MGLFGKSDFDIGLSGKAADVEKKAGADTQYTDKVKLLNGCIEAYKNDNPANLQAFLLAYLDFRRKSGKFTDMAALSLDDGLSYLVATPVLELMESKGAPEKTLAVLVREMPQNYKDILTAVALLRAEEKNNWPLSRKELDQSIDLRDTGYTGTPARVLERSMFDIDHTKKTALVNDAIRAFDEGRPANLCAFVSGYLQFKRQNGSINKLKDGTPDDGYVNLVGIPIAQMLEKSKDPKAILDTLTADMSDFYKSVLLDLVLCVASGKLGSWPAAKAALEAGADANMGGGRALYNAAIAYDHPRIVDALFLHGANFTQAPLWLTEENKQSCLQKYAALSQKYGMRPPAPALEVVTPELVQTALPAPRKTELSL